MLLESGLLATAGDGGYWFVDDHPMAATVIELAWRHSGVVRPEPLSDRFPWRTGESRFPSEDYAYRGYVPEELRTSGGNDVQRGETEGPSLVATRDLLTRFRPLFVDLTAYERNAQEVYSLWHTERLRDVIHQADFTPPLVAASTTLREVCDFTAQGQHNPWETCVPAHSWVRATYLVSATAYKVATLLGILTKAVNVGGQVNDLRSSAINMIKQIEYAPDSDFAAEWLSEARQAVAAADRMWDSHDGELPFRNVGGMPHPVDVGTAGDQILAVQLNASLCRLIDIIASMADHPSVVSWQRRHPDDGAPQLLLTNPYPLERMPRK